MTRGNRVYWGERNSLWRRALNEQRQACRSSFTECNIGREREPIVALDGYSTCIRSRRGQCIEVPFVCRSTPKASTAGGVVGKLPMASSPLLPTAFTSHQSEASTPQLSTSTDLAFQHPPLHSSSYSYLCSCLHSFLPLPIRVHARVPLLALPSFERIEYFYEKFRSQSIKIYPPCVYFLVIFVEHHWRYDCKLYWAFVLFIFSFNELADILLLDRSITLEPRLQSELGEIWSYYFRSWVSSLKIL